MTGIDSNILETMHAYFDYACAELQPSLSVYHSLEGGVNRSSTIYAKRDDICFEITLSVKAHRLAKDEV